MCYEWTFTPLQKLNSIKIRISKVTCDKRPLCFHPLLLLSSIQYFFTHTGPRPTRHGLFVGKEAEKQQFGGNYHQHPLWRVGAQGWGRGRGGRLRKCEWNNKLETQRDNCWHDVFLSVRELIYLDREGKYQMPFISETDVWFCVSDSGVGAGIDSYYEYLLKAYILLGDDMFLQRFNIVSNLISPCLHNSVCYFSSLTHSVSVFTF